MSIKKVDDHQFRITWEIDFWANSYEEAAQKAWQVMKEDSNSASVLLVEDIESEDGVKQFDMEEYNLSEDFNDIKEG